MTNECETTFTLIRSLVREASPSSLPRIFLTINYFRQPKGKEQYLNIQN